MHTNLWFWIAFNAGVLGVLAIDLFGFQRKAHVPSMKEAAIWTAVWVVLSLGFNGLIWYCEERRRGWSFSPVTWWNIPFRSTISSSSFCYSRLSASLRNISTG